MAKTIVELVSLREIEPDVFESFHLPEKMGNAANIAYGGCTIAVAAKVLHQGVPSQFRLFTIMGNYLGPALVDRLFRCSVKEVRRTRTFITRQVQVGQVQDNGQLRICMIALGDFQIPEPASLLTYSRPPMKYAGGPETCIPTEDAAQRMVDNGEIPQSLADAHTRTFGLMSRFFETRYGPDGVMSQNLKGMIRGKKTTQDHLPVTSKISSDWFRNRHRIDDVVHQVSSLAFIMDAALSFLPLAHSGLTFADAGACSSLDFALRIFMNDLNLDDFHLREFNTVTGGAGRTFSESYLWNRDGSMVASMTQTSILRPPSAKL